MRPETNPSTHLKRPSWLGCTALGSALALTVAGCGGGGEAVVAPAPAAVAADPLATLPSALASSAQAAVDYQRQLAAQPSETREPLDLGTLSLPQPDTDEPSLVE